MSRATLTITRRPDLGPGGREVVIDCEHAVTTITVVELPTPAAGVPDALAARLAVRKHHQIEGCRCTRTLRRRYGGDGGR